MIRRTLAAAACLTGSGAIAVAVPVPSIAVAAPAVGVPVGAATCADSPAPLVTDFSPRSVVVGATGSVPVTFAVQAEGCALADWTVSVPSLFVLASSEAAGDSFSSSWLDTADAGRHQAEVTVVDGAARSGTGRFTFAVLRRASFGSSVAVSPATAAPAAVRTFSGRLGRADWSAGSYTSVAGAAVTVQYRSATTRPWRTLATVTANGRGAFSAKLKITRSGYLRAGYAGLSTTSAATSSALRVRIR